MTTATPEQRDALRALILAENGDSLTPEQVEAAVDGALQFRAFGEALSALKLNNGEMPFSATFLDAVVEDDHDT